MFENRCYQRSFLKEVIIRLDFSAPIAKFGNQLAPRISKAALARFPIVEPKKAIAQELLLSGSSIERREQHFTEWNFFGREREKQLQIGQPAIWISYNRYMSFEELKSDFVSVLEAVLAEDKEAAGRRIGLRYINHICPDDAGTFDWSRYIDKGLLGLFDRFRDPGHVTRLFSVAEFKHDNIRLKFQFGAPNPDFPALIKRPLFILDLDGYIDELQEINQISPKIDRIHLHIQELFEESITNDLREAMNARPE